MIIVITSTEIRYNNIDCEKSLELFGDRAFRIKNKHHTGFYIDVEPLEEVFYIEVESLEEAIEYLDKVRAWGNYENKEYIISTSIDNNPINAKYIIELYNYYRE